MNSGKSYGVGGNIGAEFGGKMWDCLTGNINKGKITCKDMELKANTANLNYNN